MTIEDKLKEYIIQNHKSLRAFAQEVGIVYTTLGSIFKRGFNKAGIGNMITICGFLGIDTEELYYGRITKKQQAPEFALSVTDRNEKELLNMYRALDSDNQAYIRVRVKELLKEQSDTEAGDELSISKSVG